MECVVRYKNNIFLDCGTLLCVDSVEALDLLIGRKNYTIRSKSKDIIFIDTICDIDFLSSHNICELVKNNYFLEKLLGCKVIKCFRSISNVEYEVNSLLNMMNFQVQFIRCQNNSINGNVRRNSEHFFFKLVDFNNLERELTGYLTLKYKLPCSTISEVIYFENYAFIIYCYEESIGEDRGLLQDIMVKYDDLHEIPQSIIDNIRTIVKAYTSHFNDSIDIKCDYPLKFFFSDRINRMLTEWYSTELWMDYRVNINGFSGKTTREIVKDCKTYFENQQMTKGVLSHGDPNLFNIGILPIFFDFCSSGYNPINADMAVLITSTVLFDCYLAPIYHEQSFYEHVKGLYNKSIFSPNIKYTIDNERAEIRAIFDLSTSLIRYKYLQIVDEELKYINIKLDKNMKYFIAFRFISVFNLTHMDIVDRIYCISLMHYFYHLIDGLDDDDNVFIRIIDNYRILKE